MIAALVAQHAIGFVDALMISRLGSASLAGIGIANFIIMLCLAIPLGIAAGMQSLIARRVGEGLASSTGLELRLGLLISCSFGLCLSFICLRISPSLLDFISDSTQISSLGIDYIKGRSPSILFTSALMCFRAFWFGVGSPKNTIHTLFIVMMANALFNYLLIFGNFGAPEMGVFGAGLASTIASIIGVLLFIVFGWQEFRQAGFTKAKPSLKQVAKLMALSLPECVNLLFISLAILLLYLIVGQIGEIQLAILHIMINFILLAHLIVEGIGLSALTMVSHSLGKKDYCLAERFGWASSSVGAAIAIFIALFLFFFPAQTLAMFFNEPHAIKAGIMPMRLLGLWIWIDVYAKIIGFALIGAGATKTVFSVMFILYWVMGIPSQWLLGVKLDYGLSGVFLVPLVVTSISALVFSAIWKKGRWKSISL